MKELAAKSKGKKLKSTAAGEQRELDRLAGALNNFSTSALPPGTAPPPAAVETVKAAQPTQIVHATSQVPTAAQPPIQKLFLTGRFLSGKDFLAERAGYTIFSFAQPLYELQKYFFGSADKTLPGARDFLQKAGAYGRGDGPVSIERANFVALIRSQASHLPSDQGVDWDQFGSSPALWLDALRTRVSRFFRNAPDGRAAVTNVRFANEFESLIAAGFSHRHVCCSAATWTARLLAVGLTPDSPACKDVSEQLAIALDADVARKIKLPGDKLRAIWSDPTVPPPSPRLITVEDFSK